MEPIQTEILLKVIARSQTPRPAAATTITRLESKVANQELAVAQQEKQIEALTAGLQKVTARVEANFSPRVVSDD